jgi:hypothetical protein
MLENDICFRKKEKVRTGSIYSILFIEMFFLQKLERGTRAKVIWRKKIL